MLWLKEGKIITCNQVQLKDISLSKRTLTDLLDRKNYVLVDSMVKSGEPPKAVQTIEEYKEYEKIADVPFYLEKRYANLRAGSLKVLREAFNTPSKAKEESLSLARLFYDHQNDIPFIEGLIKNMSPEYYHDVIYSMFGDFSYFYEIIFPLISLQQISSFDCEELHSIKEKLTRSGLSSSFDHVLAQEQVAEENEHILSLSKRLSPSYEVQLEKVTH